MGGARHLDLFIEAHNVTNHVNFNPNVTANMVSTRSCRALRPAILGRFSGG
jgi:hypothetical protein